MSSEEETEQVTQCGPGSPEEQGTLECQSTISQDLNKLLRLSPRTSSERPPEEPLP